MCSDCYWDFWDELGTTPQVMRKAMGSEIAMQLAKLKEGLIEYFATEEIPGRDIYTQGWGYTYQEYLNKDLQEFVDRERARKVYSFIEDAFYFLENDLYDQNVHYDKSITSSPERLSVAMAWNYATIWRRVLVWGDIQGYEHDENRFDTQKRKLISWR